VGARLLRHLRIPILDKVTVATIMGADGVLVSFAVFKTDRAARGVAGEFDSHTFPPLFLTSNFLQIRGRFYL